MGKQEKIVSMFDDISKTYDLANRVLSMGIDKTWRDKSCNKAYELYGKDHLTKIVDVACGTGDMMINWKKIADQKGVKLDEIVGVDPSAGMMEVGKEKIPDGVFIQAGAQELPLEDNSADIISIAYGIRNVVQRDQAMKEFARVLKPDGLMVILEFTKNEKKSIIDHITDFYMNKLMPTIGGLISKNKEAYTYLPNSIEDFITTDKMKDELNDVGLKPVFVKGYSMDMSTTFIAQKI